MTPEGVSAGTHMAIGCIPVETCANRRYMRLLGYGHVPFPPPSGESSCGVCHLCGGDIYIGLSQQKVLDTRPDTLVVCLMCASVYLGASLAKGNVLSLSDERSEPGE